MLSGKARILGTEPHESYSFLGSAFLAPVSCQDVTHMQTQGVPLRSIRIHCSFCAAGKANSACHARCSTQTLTHSRIYLFLSILGGEHCCLPLRGTLRFSVSLGDGDPDMHAVTSIKPPAELTKMVQGGCISPGGRPRKATSACQTHPIRPTGLLARICPMMRILPALFAKKSKLAKSEFHAPLISNPNLSSHQAFAKLASACVSGKRPRLSST